MEAEVERLKGELNGQECDAAFWKARCEKVEQDIIVLLHQVNPSIAYSDYKVRG